MNNKINFFLIFSFLIFLAISLFSQYQDIDPKLQKEYNKNYKFRQIGFTETVNLVSENNEHLFFTNNYYSSAKKLVKRIGIEYNSKVYPVGLKDLSYNRPDLILKDLGYADSVQINVYHRAYEKRLQKLGFQEKNLDYNFELPESKILNSENINQVSSSPKINLELQFIDSIYNLDRIYIKINDVSIFGSQGINIKDKKVKSYKTNVDIELIVGENIIQISCINEKGTSSYNELIKINYKPKIPIKPNLYLITIGVSKYNDERFNLQYAAKDAKDIIKLYTTNEFSYFGTDIFDSIYSKNLTDEQVNKENIQTLKTFLERATVNDQVIIFYAGHGVLDQNLDYYLQLTDYYLLLSYILN